MKPSSQSVPRNTESDWSNSESPMKTSTDLVIYGGNALSSKNSTDVATIQSKENNAIVLAGQNQLVSFDDNLQLPNNHWNYDADSRVIFGNFRSNRMTEDDECFYLEALDCCDLPIVVEGLVKIQLQTDCSSFLNLYDENEEFVLCRFDSSISDNGSISTSECTKIICKAPEAANYFRKRRQFFESVGGWTNAAFDDSDEAMFEFQNGNRIHVGRVALYATDVPLKPGLLNTFNGSLQSPLNNMLPGGKLCLMNAVSLHLYQHNTSPHHRLIFHCNFFNITCSWTRMNNLILDR